MYLSKQEIVHAINEHKQGNSEPLGKAIVLLGKGLYVYLRGKGLTADVDEVTQEVAVIVLDKLDKVDLDGSPFNYLTACGLNHLRHKARNRMNHDKLIARLKDELRAQE